MTHEEKKAALEAELAALRKQVAAELEKTMTEFDLSTRAVAGVLGCSHTLIHRWCGAFFLPPLKEAEKLAKFIASVQLVAESWRDIVAGWRDRNEAYEVVKTVLYSGPFRVILDRGGNPHDKVKLLTKKTIEAWAKGDKKL